MILIFCMTFLIFSSNQATSHPIYAKSLSFFHSELVFTRIWKSVTESTNLSPESSGLSLIVYIGIGVGALVLILILALLIYWKFCRARSPSIEPEPEPEPTPGPIEKRKRPDAEQERQQWIELHKNLEKNSSLQDLLKRKSLSDFNSLTEHLKPSSAETVVEKAYLIFKCLIRDKKITKNFNFDQSVQLAREFAKYCHELRIECMVIEGYAKDDNIQSGHRFSEKNHAWNVFLYNDLWYYVDVVWAATKQKSSVHSDYWFMVPPNIFLETHFSEEFYIHEKSDLQQFEQMHANLLEYHILGLKSKNFPNSIVNCYSNPFFIEFTCNQSVNLDAILDDQNGSRLNNITLVQKENSIPFKYCVIFFVEKIQDHQHTLRLVNRREKTVINLSKYSLVFVNDQFPTNLPKYNMRFDCNIDLTSHQNLVLNCDLSYLNIEFKAPMSSSIIGVLKNLDESKQVDVTEIGQTQVKKSKLVVFSVLPNSRRSLVKFLYSNDGTNYTELVKFLVLKTTPCNEMMNEMVRIDARSEDYYIFGPLDYYLKLNQVYRFRYYFANADSIRLCNAEGRFIDLDRISSNMYEKEFKVDKPGALNVFVNKDNQTTALAFYKVGDFYTNKIDHTKSYKLFLR